MSIVLFDDQSWQTLLPLTYTRPVSEIRVGILTIAEKWKKYLKVEDISYKTVGYLQKKFPLIDVQHPLYINGSVCPDQQLAEAIDNLKEGEVLKKESLTVAAKIPATENFDHSLSNINGHSSIEYVGQVTSIRNPEDIFSLNDQELRKDYKLLTEGRESASLSKTNTIIGEDIFVEAGAQAECSSFNTSLGPIYLGENSEVWEGTNIRGSFALCAGSQVKMGSKIYGMTTIGPGCRVGGELKNVVMLGYSNKGHEGYLGNSVVGEWCNFGADTNSSNMKNNYSRVKLWDYKNSDFRETGLQFCGLIMGDHAKTGINSMLNTGTVVGVGANVFGGGFPPKFIPDFTWGGSETATEYSLDKFFITVGEVYKHRGKEFEEWEREILTEVFQLTNKYRRTK